MIDIVANAVDMRLLGLTREQQVEMYDLLSYFVEGFQNSQAYRQHRWNGKQSFFDMKHNACPAGFLPLIRQYWERKHVPTRIRRVPLPEPLGPSTLECQKKTGFPRDPRYDYQEKAVEALISYGQMIAMLATGGGKGNIAAMCYWRINRPTLFITTRMSLAYQMKEFLESRGEQVGIVGDNIWEPNLRGFNVAISQTLAVRIKDFDEKSEEFKLKHEPKLDKDFQPILDNKGNPTYKKTRQYEKALKQGGQFLASYNESIRHRLLQLRVDHEEKQQKIKDFLLAFDFVILEEAHESSANGYYNVMRHCRNAHYRLALTATPFVKDSEEANLRLMACSGPIGIRVSEKDLIDRGVLAKPYFKYLEVNNGTVPRHADWHRAYTVGIVENAHRNHLIVSEALNAVKYNLPTLILITRKKHGQVLKDLIEQRNVNVDFIFGEHSASERTDALNKLKGGDTQILIASSILDVGVDVPSLGMIILAGGGKAETSLRQRIGRGLRAKKTGKNVAYIVDFIDNTHHILKKHSRQRKGIVESIPGFAENIVKEFDL